MIIFFHYTLSCTTPEQKSFIGLMKNTSFFRKMRKFKQIKKIQLCCSEVMFNWSANIKPWSSSILHTVSKYIHYLPNSCRQYPKVKTVVSHIESISQSSELSPLLRQAPKIQSCLPYINITNHLLSLYGNIMVKFQKLGTYLNVYYTNEFTNDSDTITLVLEMQSNVSSMSLHLKKKSENIKSWLAAN